jgi:hypothetical protein
MRSTTTDQPAGGREVTEDLVRVLGQVVALRQTVDEIESLEKRQNRLRAALERVDGELRSKRVQRNELASLAAQSSLVPQKEIAKICGKTREWVRLLAKKSD